MARPQLERLPLPVLDGRGAARLARWLWDGTWVADGSSLGACMKEHGNQFDLRNLNDLHRAELVVRKLGLRHRYVEHLGYWVTNMKRAPKVGNWSIGLFDFQCAGWKRRASALLSLRREVRSGV